MNIKEKAALKYEYRDKICMALGGPQSRYILCGDCRYEDDCPYDVVIQMVIDIAERVKEAAK